MGRGGAATRLGRVRRAWQRHGGVGFVRLCFYNLRLMIDGTASRHQWVYDDAWDRAHGVDTAGIVEVDEIVAEASRKLQAVRYEATPPECFDYLIEQAAMGDPAHMTFVDLGSGKGRVVIMAAMAGFRKAVGVEMGAELHRVATANLGRLRERLGAAEIELVHGDARESPLEPEPTVYFLNNPFGAGVLDEMLERIERSVECAPRPFTIIYYHSNHAERVKGRAFWQTVAEGWWRDESHHYSIFRWQP